MENISYFLNKALADQKRLRYFNKIMNHIYKNIIVLTIQSRTDQLKLFPVNNDK